MLDRATLESWGVARPSRLAFDGEGSLYVLDDVRRRLVKVDSEGRFLHEVTLSGVGSAGIPDPADLVVDARGSVLVLDRSSGAVLAYDKGGAFLAARPLAPDLVEDARAPGAALLLDGFGKLWLFSPRERDLIRLNDALARDRAGRFLTPEDSLGLPGRAAFLSNGEAWIADAATGRLRRYRASGAASGIASLADSGRAASIAALAADRAGYLYAAEGAGQRIVALGPAGARVLERSMGGSTRPWRPAALAWGARDRLAVSDADRGEIQILAIERESRK